MSRYSTPTISLTQKVTRLACECEELGRDPILWRRHLAAGILKLIPESVSLLYEITPPTQSDNPDPTEDPVHPVLIDDGWIDHACKDAFYEYLASGDAASNPLLGAIQSLKPGIFSTSAYEIEPEDAWRARPVAAYMARARVDFNCITHAKKLPSGRIQVVTVHRHLGRDDWSTTEQQLLSLLFETLHSKLDSILAPVGDPSVTDLPPRALAVLEAALRGLSNKQIAAERGLSIHTINEYTKLIHRHFAVQSRSELQARLAGVHFRNQIDPKFGHRADS